MNTQPAYAKTEIAIGTEIVMVRRNLGCRDRGVEVYRATIVRQTPKCWVDAAGTKYDKATNARTPRYMSDVIFCVAAKDFDKAAKWRA
jgi:hypothetical protein